MKHRRTGRTSSEVAKRIHDLAVARDLAANGSPEGVAAARAIFAAHRVSHVAVEINRTTPSMVRR